MNSCIHTQRSILAGLIFASISTSSFADTLSWTGNGDAVNNDAFSSASNWSPSFIPALADTAIFDRANLLHSFGPGVDNLINITDGTSIGTLTVNQGNFQFDAAAGSFSVVSTTVENKPGDADPAKLTLTHGTFSTTQFSIGIKANTSGRVDVGAGANLILNQGSVIGSLGQAEMNVSGGGTLTSSGASFFIGMSGASTGKLTVSGNGSSFTNSTYTLVAQGAQGSLLIENGAHVSDNESFIGINELSLGDAIVTGAGSRWDTQSSSHIGDFGQGSLQILNGAVVSTGQNAYIANSNTSQGDVTVDGAQSRWDVGGLLYVGLAGQGNLTVRNGASVTSHAGVVGIGIGPLSVASVAGQGSSWVIGTQLFVGNQGTGALTISNGGSVSVGTEIIIQPNGSIELAG